MLGQIPFETSEDSLFDGQLPFTQPKRGYRVNVDALLLADFARSKRAAQLAVDLGAGVGIVALLLHYFGACRESLVIEKDKHLSDLAEHNLARFGARYASCHCDLALGRLPEKWRQQADLVVANPPYYDPQSRRPAQLGMKETARAGALEPFLRAASSALCGEKARACFIYPAAALPQLAEASARFKLSLKRLRLVHAKAELKARVFLVELRRGTKNSGLVIEPALIEWRAPGQRSPELERIITGQIADQK